MKTNHIYTRIHSQFFCRRFIQGFIPPQCIKADKTGMIAPVVMFEIARDRQSVSGTVPRNRVNSCTATFTTANSVANLKTLNLLALFVAFIVA